MARPIVVDTSVVVKWFKTRDEELVDDARALLRSIDARDVAVHVPALLFYEIGNILLVKTKLDAPGLESALYRIAALPFIVAPPIGPLMARAAALGRRLGLTFYDASFLALAAELDCTCVTADRRLVERAAGLPNVRHLSKVGDLS
jgi:predicted nucleic acid-binding protein